MPKANKQLKRNSSTRGRDKGENCQRSQLKNLMSKDSRLYKTNPKLYSMCMQAVDKMKGNRLHNPEWYQEQATGVEVVGAF